MKSEAEIHAVASDTLIKAFEDGSHDEIRHVLKQLSYLDGEAWRILVGLICEDADLKTRFENRLVLARWRKGAPQNVGSSLLGKQYIVHTIRTGLKHGKNLKFLVAMISEELSTSRAVIMQAWSEHRKSLDKDW
ncbi:hypothetical protein [Tardiphaga robiniae]|uniref:Uncharacterized protein n=1 Tax=Tardiphaga robiniae TaxID=943830 RepID=A0A164B306_9BRAD|nr:hypothetical protein [Tardiphaga robiniae]KZD25686.1 hypothetical protein A4A58_04630 [Tardiphaga robiniae]